MNDLDKQKLFWLRIMTVGVIAVFVLMLVFTIGAVSAAQTLRSYETRIDAVLTRAETVSADLEALDTAGLVSTVNGISEQLREADIASTLESLGNTAAELESIDWKDTLDKLNAAAGQAEETMRLARESMEKMDIESLTQAIQELRDAVAPMAALGSLFR